MTDPYHQTPGSGVSVLVVDDTAINRDIISNKLKRMDFTVYEVDSGLGALDLLDLVQTDIILLDLMMPGIDGFETIRRIRKRPVYAMTPIIVTSALEDTASTVMAIETGADDYITKPICLPVLAAKVGRLSNAIRTARQRHELELRTQAMGEAVPDALILIDEWGVIQWANPATGRIFGFALPQVLGQNVSMLMPEPDRSSHDGYLARYRAGGQGAVVGARRRASGLRADGRRFPIELAVQKLSLPSGPHYLGIVRDMSAEEELERMKQDFVSVINHELRTPLTSIVGSLSLLAAGAAGELSPHADKMVNVALRNTRRLGRLINDILDLDKIDCGALALTYSDLNARHLLDEALQLNQDAARAAGISLRMEFETVGCSQPVLRVDADRFQQVMSNLLSNAIKFSPAGCEVLVSVESDGTHLRIAVADHGPGIPEEFHSQLFKRFSQHARPDSRQREGSGLGLSITRALVQQMGGEIGFDKTRSEGSLFFFTLPLCNPGG